MLQPAVDMISADSRTPAGMTDGKHPVGVADSRKGSTRAGRTRSSANPSPSTALGIGTILAHSPATTCSASDPRRPVCVVAGTRGLSDGPRPAHSHLDALESK